MLGRIATCVLLAASVGWAGSARDELLDLRAKLAASRTLDRSSGIAKLLAFAESHRKDEALAAELLYDVGHTQRRVDRQKKPSAWVALLERYPKSEPWAALATFELARVYALESTTRPEAVALYEKFLALEGQAAWRRAKALYGLAYSFQETGKYPQALTQYQRYMDEFKAERRGCADALAAISGLLVRLKRPKEAYQAYLRLAKEYPWATVEQGDLLLSVAQGFRTAEDHEGARTAYERLLAEATGTDTRRAYAYRGLAMLELQQKDSAGAAAIYLRMAKDVHLTASYRVQAYSHLFEMHRKANNYEAMIELSYQLIAAHPSRVLSSSYRVFDELVDAMVGEGRIEEALGIAKAYYRLGELGNGGSSRSAYRNSSGTSSRQYAILTVVRALKAREGGLRSANAFLAFVSYGLEGPDGKLGTQDDSPDPLAQYHLPADKERDALFEAAARRLRPDPFELGYLYICWDKPDEALRAFRRHYLAARTSIQLQAAASLLAGALRAVGRSEADVDAFFDFQNYGPHGKDGKPGTNDDLKDPILVERK